MKKFLLASMLFSCIIDVKAQFTTPTINGTISGGEYGSHTNGNNAWSDGSRTWYMTWDATNLYIAVSNNGNAGADELVLYIDTDPQAIVNGGSNTNGCTGGIGHLTVITMVFCHLELILMHTFEMITTNIEQITVIILGLQIRIIVALLPKQLQVICRKSL